MSTRKLCEVCEGPIVGRRSDAKTCSKECRKEAVRERDAAYYRANRDAVLARDAEYRRANRDAISARQAEHRREGRGRAIQALHGAIKRCHVPSPITGELNEDYGARGIEVHPRYRDGLTPLVDNLIADIGLPREKDQLDRIDGSKGYEPGNLRWVTPRGYLLNRCNTRWLTHNGRTLCLSDWARELGVDLGTIWSRLRSGWPVEKALSTPPIPPAVSGRRGALAARLATSTPEERSERARRSAATRLAKTTPEERSEISRRAWATRRANNANPKSTPRAA